MKTNLNKLELYILTSLVLISSFVPSKVFAVDMDFYSSNNILYYNPDSTCSTSSSNIPSGEAEGLTQNETSKLIFQTLLNGGFNSVQAAAAMGNFWRESGFNSSAEEFPGAGGWGLAQWTAGRRTNVLAYLAGKGLDKADLAGQLEFFFIEYNDTYKSKLEGTAFENATDLSQATYDFMMKFEVPALSTAAFDSVRLPAAQQVYGWYKDLAATSGSSSTSGSSNCGEAANSAVVTNDIVKTALNFALTPTVAEGTIEKSQARDTYQVAKEQYNPGDDNSWTDCSVFIATVMIASGVDTNYPKVNVPTQVQYARNNPGKYTVISNATMADLQPGDILYTAVKDHTMLYTGEQEFSGADASLHEDEGGKPNGRVPSVFNSAKLTDVMSKGPTIARFIKK